jgi:hypothetical protein
VNISPAIQPARTPLKRLKEDWDNTYGGGRTGKVDSRQRHPALHVMNLAMPAHRASHPDQFPWFSEACAFSFHSDLERAAFAEAGVKPTIN